MKLCTDTISAALPPGSLFAGHILAEERVDSTNTRLKGLAGQGAPEGSVLLAEEQTGGRGTRGRTFYSPRGRGLYLSLLLRPDLPVEELVTLTGWVAVAVRRGIGRVCGAPVDIKWLNDLYLNGRKVCGVLTELCPGGGVVIGIGVNLAQSREEFRAQGLDEIATSLSAEGYQVSREELCASLLCALEEMCRAFPREKQLWLEEYRGGCITPGRKVAFEWEGRCLSGIAFGVDGSFALTVEGEDGVTRSISAGTVSQL